MFHLEESNFGPYHRFRFDHPELGHGFDLVPAAGANITALRFSGTNVLDGYETPEDLQGGHWGKSAILFPFPNRLRDGHYTWLDREYSFPINNASTKNAIHGFVRHEAFEPTRIEITKEFASITSRLEASGENTSYPFPFTLDVTFTITIRGEFLAKFSLSNLGPNPIPAGLGWHPYFRLAPHANEHTLHLPACERIDIDERMIPTGKRFHYADFQDQRSLEETQLDTCFAASQSEPVVRVRLSSKEHELTLEAPRHMFPFFQVFTPPMRTSIAIEPMTCNIDAFHNGEGLVELPPSVVGVWTPEFRIVYRKNEVTSA